MSELARSEFCAMCGATPGSRVRRFWTARSIGPKMCPWIRNGTSTAIPENSTQAIPNRSLRLIRPVRRLLTPPISTGTPVVSRASVGGIESCPAHRAIFLHREE